MNPIGQQVGQTWYDHIGPNHGRISGQNVAAGSLVYLEVTPQEKDHGMVTCIFLCFFISYILGGLF